MKKLSIVGKPYRTTEPVGIYRLQIPCNVMISEYGAASSFCTEFYRPAQPIVLIGIGRRVGTAATYEVSRRN